MSWLFVLSACCLAYSVVAWRYFAAPLLTRIRRVYYSCWLFFCAAILPYAGSANMFGKNELGLSPEVWALFVLLVMGVLVDMLVISCFSIKSISVGSARIEASDVAPLIVQGRDLVISLSGKIEAQYQTIASIDIDGIAERLGDLDIVSEFRKALDRYLELQGDRQNQAFDIFMLSGIDQAEKKYRLNGRERSLLERNARNYCATQVKRGDYMLFIPYESIVKEATVIVVLLSKEQIVNAESYLIIAILEHLEDIVLDLESCTS